MPLTLALLKVPFILARAGITYTSLTPPALSQGDERQKPQGLERLFSMMIKWPPLTVKVRPIRSHRTSIPSSNVRCTQFAFVFDALAESACIIATSFPSSLSSRVLMTLTGSPILPASLFAPSTSWTIGMILALTGGAFRLWAFQALGRHFTFELSVLKDHELVTTGPYAIVRHPSYTGLVALMWGTTLTIGSRGTWTREVLFVDVFRAASAAGTSTSDWAGMAAWARWFAGMNFALQFVVAAAMVARTKTEDAMLKRTFGKRWDEWAGKTPWRLLPGVY
jgi:protein-S-isoprenylcysteine O-methyltransferase Ste14